MKIFIVIFMLLSFAITGYAVIIEGQYETDKDTFKAIEVKMRELTKDLPQPAQRLRHIDNGDAIMFWADSRIEKLVNMSNVIINGYYYYSKIGGGIDSEKLVNNTSLSVGIIQDTNDAKLKHKEFLNYKNELSSTTK